jgi:predicted membrane channel-forming protein YqfA (hemolysin III family)
MLIGGNTIIEGIILITFGSFIYLWAINTAPLVMLAQIACNLPSVSNVLSQTCSKVNLNANIISYTPDIAIIIAIFGGILLIMGVIIISSEKEEGGERKGSWRDRYHFYHGNR